MAVNFTRGLPFRSFLQQISARPLPGSCLLCGADSAREALCSACAVRLPRLPTARCPVCALGLHRDGHCPACRLARPAFDATLALHPYEFPVDRLIHQLKYGHQLGVARWFGKRLAALPDLPGADAVLAIPLHEKRLRERGFNQAHEIARHLTRRPSPIPLRSDILLRTRATAAQAGLDHAARAVNLRGAFECRHDLSDQHLLLVDDVLTTGHTVNEAARVLKCHGAATVTVVVIARALRHPDSDRLD